MRESDRGRVRGREKRGGRRKGGTERERKRKRGREKKRLLVQHVFHAVFSHLLELAIIISEGHQHCQ